MILAGGQLTSGIIWTVFQREYQLSFASFPLGSTYIFVYLLVTVTFALSNAGL